MVEELRSYTSQDLASLDGLMRELSATSSCTEGRLREALSDENTRIFVIRDGGHIVATGTLCIKHMLETSNEVISLYFALFFTSLVINPLNAFL